MTSIGESPYKREAPETPQREAKRAHIEETPPVASTINQIFQSTPIQSDSIEKLLEGIVDQNERDIVHTFIEIFPQLKKARELKKVLPILTSYPSLLIHLCQRMRQETTIAKEIVLRKLWLIGDLKLPSHLPYFYQLMDQKLTEDELKKLEHILYGLDKGVFMTSIAILSKNGTIDWKEWIAKVPQDLPRYELIEFIGKKVPSPHLQRLIDEKLNLIQLKYIKILVKSMDAQAVARSLDAFAYANGGEMPWTLWCTKIKEDIPPLTAIFERLKSLNQNPFIQAIHTTLLTSNLPLKSLEKLIKHIEEWIDAGCSHEKQLIDWVVNIHQMDLLPQDLAALFFSLPLSVAEETIPEILSQKIPKDRLTPLIQSFLMIDKGAIEETIQYLRKLRGNLDWAVNGPRFSLFVQLRNMYGSLEKAPIAEILEQNPNVSQVLQITTELDHLAGKPLPMILDFVKAVTGKMDWIKYGHHLQLFSYIYECIPSSFQVSMILEILQQNPNDNELSAIKTNLLALEPSIILDTIKCLKELIGTMDWIKHGTRLKFYSVTLIWAKGTLPIQSLAPTSDTLQDTCAIYLRQANAKVEEIKPLITLHRSLNTPSFKKILFSYLTTIPNLHKMEIPYDRVTKILLQLETKGDSFVHLVPFVLFSPPGLFDALETKISGIDPENPEAIWNAEEKALYLQRLETLDQLSRKWLLSLYYLDVRDGIAGNKILEAAKEFLIQQSFRWMSSNEHPVIPFPDGTYEANDFILFFKTPSHLIPDPISRHLIESFKKVLEENLRPEVQLQMCCWEFCFMALLRSKIIGADIVRKMYQTQNTQPLYHLINRALINDADINRFATLDNRKPRPGDILLYKYSKPNIPFRHAAIYHSENTVIELLSRRVQQFPIFESASSIHIIPSEMVARNIHTFVTNFFQPNKPPEVNRDTLSRIFESQQYTSFQ